MVEPRKEAVMLTVLLLVATAVGLEWLQLRLGARVRLAPAADPFRREVAR